MKRKYLLKKPLTKDEIDNLWESTRGIEKVMIKMLNGSKIRTRKEKSCKELKEKV